MTRPLTAGQLGVRDALQRLKPLPRGSFSPLMSNISLRSPQGSVPVQSLMIAGLVVALLLSSVSFAFVMLSLFGSVLPTVSSQRDVYGTMFVREDRIGMWTTQPVAHFEVRVLRSSCLLD
jgi:hypothetical protein